jgi:transposase
VSTRGTERRAFVRSSWNPQLNAIYHRLIAAGKPHKVGLVACARKLLIYANTAVERGTPWTERPAAI